MPWQVPAFLRKHQNRYGNYYPFGLTMAGISSKALAFGDPKNKEQTFQEQRFDDDLGLNWVQFKWRNHDPQIGRFVEIDPLSDKYVYNSTYAFSENKVTNHVELEGLESVSAFFKTLLHSAGYSENTDSKTFIKNVSKEAVNPDNAAKAIEVLGQTVVAPLLVTVMTGGTGSGAVLSAEASAGESALQKSAPVEVAPISLEARAKQIHSALSPRTQGSTTTAVATATTSEGNNVTLVASSETKLRTPQIQALKPGEISVSGQGHAEVTILNYGQANNMTVNAVAASRPICEGCATAINNAGAVMASPVKIIPPATQSSTYVKPPVILPPRQ